MTRSHARMAAVIIALLHAAQGLPVPPLVAIEGTNSVLHERGQPATIAAVGADVMAAPPTPPDEKDKPRVTILSDDLLEAIGAGKKTVREDGSEAKDANVEQSVAPAADTNVSINHVEAHLQILQDLEMTIAKSIAQLDGQTEGEDGDHHAVKATGEVARLSKELMAVQTNLKKLAEGLNGTLHELEAVGKDTEDKSKKLQEVLQLQQEEKAQDFIEEHGLKAVDYESGRLRNSTDLGLLRGKKIEEAEKKADPAVLHYDFQLLGQIAILLGVAAIGGIIATYFNIPPNIGYLLGGAVVGPSCLTAVRQYKEVETISLFGSIFLLFGHGAGYTMQSPDRGLKKYLIGGLAYITATVTLIAFTSVHLGWSSSFMEGMTVGVAVCFTTTAPLYEYIRVRQIQDTSFGRTVTAIIAVQDLLMSFALGAPEWFSVRSVGWIGVAALRSIISYGMVVAIAIGLHFYVVPPLLHFLTTMEQVHHSPLVLLGVVSVCLFMALFSELIGLSLECGAFLAGLAFVKASRDAPNAFTSIRVIENLFGSMFFACVGMILNPIFLIKNAGEILSMVALIVVVKTLVMALVMTFFNISIKQALYAGVGLCQIGELALIFMIKAHSSKLVARHIYLLFVATISIFLGCSSIFNRRLMIARRRSISRLPTRMPKAAEPQDEDQPRHRVHGRSDDKEDSASPETPRERKIVPTRVEYEFE